MSRSGRCEIETPQYVIRSGVKLLKRIQRCQNDATWVVTHIEGTEIHTVCDAHLIRVLDDGANLIETI